MTKEKILKYLSATEWTDEVQERLEWAVSEYMVYNQDPDSGYVYNRAYYITETEARADYLSRNSVASGRWCYVVLTETHAPEPLWEQREVHERW